MRLSLLIACVFFLHSCKNEKIPPVNNGTIQLPDHFKNVISDEETEGSLDILFIGDWGYESGNLYDVSEQMGLVGDYLGVDFILTLGDNFYEHGVDSLNDPIFNVYLDNFNQEALQIPWYVSLGNHDHYGDVQVQVEFTEVDDRWNLPAQFYSRSFSIPGSSDSLSLLVLDTEILEEDSNELGQIDFIDQFFSTTNSKWKLVIGHHPLYSYGYHGESLVLQDILESKFNSNEVDAYVAGHDHDLQHIKTENITHHFISGSAAKLRPTDWGEYTLYSNSVYGFMLGRLSASSFQFYFIDQYGDVLYMYKLEK